MTPIKTYVKSRFICTRENLGSPSVFFPIPIPSQSDQILDSPTEDSQIKSTITFVTKLRPSSENNFILSGCSKNATSSRDVPSWYAIFSQKSKIEGGHIRIFHRHFQPRPSSTSGEKQGSSEESLGLWINFDENTEQIEAEYSIDVWQEENGEKLLRTGHIRLYFNSGIFNTEKF